MGLADRSRSQVKGVDEKRCRPAVEREVAVCSQDQELGGKASGGLRLGPRDFVLDCPETLKERVIFDPILPNRIVVRRRACGLPLSDEREQQGIAAETDRRRQC